MDRRALSPQWVGSTRTARRRPEATRSKGGIPQNTGNHEKRLRFHLFRPMVRGTGHCRACKAAGEGGHIPEKGSPKTDTGTPPGFGVSLLRRRRDSCAAVYRVDGHAVANARPFGRMRPARPILTARGTEGARPEAEEDFPVRIETVRRKTGTPWLRLRKPGTRSERAAIEVEREETPVIALRRRLSAAVRGLRRLSPEAAPGAFVLALDVAPGPAVDGGVEDGLLRGGRAPWTVATAFPLIIRSTGDDGGRLTSARAERTGRCGAEAAVAGALRASGREPTTQPPDSAASSCPLREWE